MRTCRAPCLIIIIMQRSCSRQQAVKMAPKNEPGKGPFVRHQSGHTINSATMSAAPPAQGCCCMSTRGSAHTLENASSLSAYTRRGRGNGGFSMVAECSCKLPGRSSRAAVLHTSASTRRDRCGTKGNPGLCASRSCGWQARASER